MAIYTYAARRIWKCKACGHQFSVTSGTIFASRKLPIRDYLAAIAIFVNAVKGVSALQLGRDLDCQYKTAFVLAHKLREAIGAEQIKGELAGDGGGRWRLLRRPRQAGERKDDRKDRRLPENQTGKRRPLWWPASAAAGRSRSWSPKESDGVALIRQVVAPGSTVHADEAGGWDLLHAFYDVKRINHSIAFSLDGACTNQAESYFSRLRRAEFGQHHHISAASIWPPTRSRWLGARIGGGAERQLHGMMTAAALGHPVSRMWAGYWQREVER